MKLKASPFCHYAELIMSRRDNMWQRNEILRPNATPSFRQTKARPIFYPNLRSCCNDEIERSTSISGSLDAAIEMLIIAAFGRMVWCVGKGSSVLLRYIRRSCRGVEDWCLSPEVTYIRRWKSQAVGWGRNRLGPGLAPHVLRKLSRISESFALQSRHQISKN